MKNKALLFFGLIIALPFASNAAVDDKEIATCAAKENMVERVACYDELAKKHNLVSQSKSTSSVGKGKWDTWENTDPLTDKTVYMASLDADEGKSKRGDKPFYLTVVCRDNKTKMYVGWNKFIRTDEHLVTYRIDKDAAKSSFWNISTDYKTSFFPDSPVSTLKRIVNSTAFIANVTPYGESPVTAIFDTRGADVALADIRKACNW